MLGVFGLSSVQGGVGAPLQENSRFLVTGTVSEEGPQLRGEFLL